MITAETLAWYQRCFFEVADRLKAESWVRTMVLGDAFLNLKPNDYATVWKLYGYIGGPDVLDLIMNRLYRPLWRRLKGDDNPLALEDEILLLELKSNVAIKCMPVDGNWAMILKMDLALDQLERRKAAEGGTPTRAMKENLEAFLADIPWKLTLPK